jgi:hypothetical protein
MPDLNNHFTIATLARRLLDYLPDLHQKIAV